MNKEEPAMISLNMRLGVSIDVTPEEFEILKKADKTAETTLKDIIHSDRCVANGDTYFPEPWNEDYISDDIDFYLPFIPLHPVQQANKVYMLCEEHEDDNGIRSFNVLAVSQNREDLKELLKAKISKDEYGTIALNGIEENFETWFKTEFKEGIGVLEYYILEQDVLQREEINKLLESSEYSDFFEYPDNLRDILTPTLNNCLRIMNLENVNVDWAMDSILADKDFQAIVKTSWWGNSNHINEDVRGLVTVVKRDFVDFVQQKLGLGLVLEAEKFTLDEKVKKASELIEEDNHTGKGRDLQNDGER